MNTLYRNDTTFKSAEECFQAIEENSIADIGIIVETKLPPYTPKKVFEKCISYKFLTVNLKNLDTDEYENSGGVMIFYNEKKVTISNVFAYEKLEQIYVEVRSVENANIHFLLCAFYVRPNMQWGKFQIEETAEYWKKLFVKYKDIPFIAIGDNNLYFSMDNDCFVTQAKHTSNIYGIQSYLKLLMDNKFQQFNTFENGYGNIIDVCLALLKEKLIIKCVTFDSLFPFLKQEKCHIPLMYTINVKEHFE